jgi:membrane protease YdiL (CAAX protease family)
MLKNIIIIALYIAGMALAVVPYLLIDTIQAINDPYEITAFIVTYLTIFVVLGYHIVKTLKRDFRPFIQGIGLNIGLIVGFFGVAFIFSLIGNVILTLLGVTDEAANQGGLIDMIKYASSRELILLVLLFTLVVPIIEELVFRKALYGFIKGFIFTYIYSSSTEEESIHPKIVIGSIIAVIISGLIFGVIHIQGDWIYLLLYGSAGIVLTLSYYVSKENIYVPLGIHIIQNIIGVTQILFLIESGII